MLRYLGSQTMEKSAKDEDILNYEELRISACRYLTDVFYDGPARHLLKATDEGVLNQGFQDLEGISQYAGEISHRVWSQQAILEVLGLPKLKNLPFSVHSEHMQAHALHLLEDDDDDSCDGKPVNLVVHPAVLAYGGGSGEDYGTHRVWMKAVVWLGE
jgi:hypothetical protein